MDYINQNILGKFMVENTKKELGAFYTPTHTVDYMISKLNGFSKASKLFEPCGGDGVFVSRILKKKLSTFNLQV